MFIGSNANKFLDETDLGIIKKYRKKRFSQVITEIN